MYLFGFAFAMWLAGRRADAPNSGWTRNEVSDLLFYGFLGVILGGRVGYVLFYNFDMFLADPLPVQDLDRWHVVPRRPDRGHYRHGLVCPQDQPPLLHRG